MELNTNYYTGSYTFTRDMKYCDSLYTLADSGIVVPNQMIDMSAFLWACTNDALSQPCFVRVHRYSGEGTFIDAVQNVNFAVTNYCPVKMFDQNNGDASDFQYTNNGSRLGMEASVGKIPNCAPIIEMQTLGFCLLIYVTYNTVNSYTMVDGRKVFNLGSGYTITYGSFRQNATLCQQLNDGDIIITEVKAKCYYGTPTARSSQRTLGIACSRGGEKIKCTIVNEYTDGKSYCERDSLLTSDSFFDTYDYCLIQGGGYNATPAADKNTIVYIPRLNPLIWNLGYTSQSLTSAYIMAYIDTVSQLDSAYHSYLATGFIITGSETTAGSGDFSGGELPEDAETGEKSDDGKTNGKQGTRDKTGQSDDPTKMRDTGWNGNEGIDPNNYTDSTPIEPPAISTVGTFNRTYAMSYSQIRALADELWNADDSIFDEIVQGLALLGECPMQGLIDLRLYPFNISTVIGGGTSESIRVGRTTLTATGIKMSNDVNAIIDLGSCTFFKNFKSFLDYAPYTEARLYIPYCGIVPIDTAEFMGKTITAKMIVDVVTGACEAFVYADQIIVAHANGNIGVSIPMTGDNAAAYSASILGGIVGGTVDVVSGALSGSVVKAVGGAADVMGGMLGAAPTQYAKAGSASSACSMWLPQYAYFIIDRPVELTPEGYGHTVGYACEEYGVLSSFSGYTVCKNVDLTGISATEAEKDMIREMLEGGFYV